VTNRHTLRAGDLESILGRLEELVLANSGEDEFEEIFKLLVARLLSEVTPDRAGDFHVQKSAQETAQRINCLLAEANKRWPGILLDHPLSRLTDEHLTVCVEALQDLSLLDTHLEVLDAAFEYLVSRSAKGSKGQYFTPRYVIDCCVKVINPAPDELVLDPACGSSGFLIHALKHMRQHYPLLNVARYCENNLWGCDFDHRAIRVAKALMLIAGDGKANLMRLNSLITPNMRETLFDVDAPDHAIARLTIEDVLLSRFPHFKGFDVILTNPPFAGEVKEPSVLDAYDLSRGKKRIERDALFLERCVRLLKPGGRLAIILPHNKLSSSAWAYAREWLVRHLRVVAVLGLGRNTFLPHTHQKANILFAIKREHPIHKPNNEDILFLISEREGKDSKGQIVARPGTKPDDAAWIRADHDLDELVTTFHNFTRSSNIPWGAIQWEEVQ
jgi:type I restriction enzyme M protein